MVVLPTFTSSIAIASLFILVTAHPGEHHEADHVKRKLEIRDNTARHAARSLSSCAGTLGARALEQRAVARRHQTAEKLRKERGISNSNHLFFHRRDLAALQEFEKVNHNMTGVVTDPQTIFSANTSAILTSENTIGPYYVLGELIRTNVTEGQPGVPIHLEIQFIDVNTCLPVPHLLIDIWAANSTGVYSGVDSAGQGGLNSTYMRGVQPTSADGVADFDTIFPGHYDGRATHEHVVAHVNASILSNGSYTGGTVAHIGQLFFDESLRSAVEATYPYSQNDLAITSNDDDMWAPTQADNDYDPFPEFVYLGDDITDGLLMWISIGIDPTANHSSNVSYAAYLAADGGHATSSTLSGGGSAPNSTNGTTPSGTITGTISSGTAAPVKERRGLGYNLKKQFSGSAARLV